jgi:hypothetical protein
VCAQQKKEFLLLHSSDELGELVSVVKGLYRLACMVGFVFGHPLAYIDDM